MMALDARTIAGLAEHLETCELQARDTPKITDEHPDMDWADAYAIQVVSESMSPLHKPGDLCFIHPHRFYRDGDSIVVQKCNNVAACFLYAGIPRSGQALSLPALDENNIGKLVPRPFQQSRIVVNDQDDLNGRGRLVLHRLHGGAKFIPPLL